MSSILIAFSTQSVRLAHWESACLTCTRREGQYLGRAPSFELAPEAQEMQGISREKNMATITSPVWNNVSYNLLTAHAEEATWVNDYPDPCQLYRYSRKYGMGLCQHPGMDISMPHGTPIYAARGGSVPYIRNQDISGSMEIAVDDAQGHRYLYTHLSGRTVSVGSSVSQGQLIGYSGTANSPHLHFEHRVPDSSQEAGWRIIDPMPVLTGGGGTTPPPTGPKFSVHDKAYCTDGPLNMRSSASTGAGVVGSIPEGADVCVVGGPTSANGYVWWNITYGSVAGWSVENFLGLREAQGCAPEPPPEPEPEPEPEPNPNLFVVGDKAYTTEGSLNVRSAPTTSGTVLGQFNSNVDCCVLDGPTEANGYVWWKVDSGSLVGWCVENFLALREAQGCVEPDPEPDPEPEPDPPTNKFAVNDKAYCTDGPLNVRSAATTGAGVLGTVPTNGDVCIMEGPVDANGYTWYKVKYNSLIGWAVENFLAMRTPQGCVAPPPPPPPTWTHKVTNQSLNMRSGAGTNFGVITSLPVGTRLRINSGPVANQGYQWYNITAENKGTGWVVNGFDSI